MAPQIRPFTPADCAAARTLWERTAGVGLSAADEEPALHRFLHRNPNLSFVAEDKGALVGTILVGHDGRRGLIHHLAVADSHRRLGLGRGLLNAGLAALTATGIQKCHILVFADNAEGRAFWESVGATRRDDLLIYSRTTA